MTDITEEIAEQVRRDKMLKLWQRYGKIAVAVIVLVLGGAAAHGIWKGQQNRQLAEATTALVMAVQEYTPDKATEAIAAMGQLTDNDWKAGFYQASIMLQAGQGAEARAAYQALAAHAKVPQLYKQLAQLLAAQSQLASLSREAAEAELLPLAGAGLPWRHPARELLVAVAVRAGDKTAARAWLETMLADGETPSAMRERATHMQAQLGEENSK